MLAPPASAAGDSGTYKFTVASDGHIGYVSNPNGEMHDLLMDRVRESGSQRHFDLGDMVHADSTLMPIVRSKYSALTIPYHVTAGNHDDPAMMQSVFGLASLDYTVVDGDLAIIVLDSRNYTSGTGYPISAAQMTYLEDALNEHADKLCFVMMHVGQARISGTNVEANNADFTTLMQQHSSHLGGVLCGHTHSAAHQVVNGVNYIHTGTFGSTYVTPSTTNPGYGYVTVEVAPSGSGYEISVAYHDLTTGAVMSSVMDATYTISMGEIKVWANPTAGKASTGSWVTPDGSPTTAPGAGDHLIFNTTSVQDVELDSSVKYGTILFDTGYTGTITTGANPEVNVAGDVIRKNGIIASSATTVWSIGGDWEVSNVTPIYPDFDPFTLYIRMMGDGNVFRCMDGSIRYLGIEFHGDTLWDTNSMASHNLLIGPDVTVTIPAGKTPVWYGVGDAPYFVNEGRIVGDGEFRIVAQYSSFDIGDIGRVECTVGVRVSGLWSFPEDATITMIDDWRDVVGPIYIMSGKTQKLVLDANGNNISATRIDIQSGGALLGGSGTIVVSEWISTAGTWTPEDSTVVLRDGGTAYLAPSQSISRLEVQSVQSSAEWTMATIGTVTPHVTGLMASSTYLWYLDGMEQGEVVADANGTIALSYESTGLHELAVKPTQMTIAMDGVYMAFSIMIVCAVIGGVFAMVGRVRF